MCGPVQADMIRASTLGVIKMNLLYQFIFYLLLTLACSDGARAEVDAVCEEDMINNCACALPIMQSRLSPPEIALLMQAWAIRIEPARRQSDFFRRNSAYLLSISERYAEIKYVIAMRCGDVAFNDE